MTGPFRIVAVATALLLVASAAGVTAAAQTFQEGMRAYRSGDYDTAYRAFRSLADRGDRRAQGSLGDMYRKGYGVAQDPVEAVNWYRRAAEQGSAHAQDGLGVMYRDGLGVPHDAECAYIWFAIAARNFGAARSDRRQRAAASRDRVAASLGRPAQERAQRIARQWRPGARLDCPAPYSQRAGPGLAQQGIRAPIWIIVAILALAAILVLLWTRSGRRRSEPETGTPPAPDLDAWPLLPEPGSVIAGPAYVTDGDGIRVNGHEIRLAGLDAPEWDQWAQHQNGYWFRHGKQVKRELIRAVGGKHVHVAVHDIDMYGRVIGTVFCNGHDVGEWLVEQGHAIAAYGDQYEDVEAEARRAGRGMWGYATSFDPRSWRASQKTDG